MDSQTPKVYSVSELTREIQTILDARFAFLWVEGEISNFSAPVSGHYYMALKDEGSQIRAVMFRPQVRYLKFLPENGMRVIAQGRVGVYAARGEYQIVLDYLEPLGVGALALAFEQLKKKLAAQGIFDAAIKRPLPYLPQRVAVITSPTGAAVRDFLKIAGRRFANLEITVVPVRVQGEGAAGEISDALDLVNRELAVDVIVLTRGGGSLEDLWAFNDEALALAIRRSRIPVVSAVGHEIDWTISDLAADLRAPTPSAAAELLVQEKDILISRLTGIRDRLASTGKQRLKGLSRQLGRMAGALRAPVKRIDDNWMRLGECHTRLVRQATLALRLRGDSLASERRALTLYSPMARVALMGQRLDFSKTSLSRAMDRRAEDVRTVLSVISKRLQDLSPLAILRRGYSITRKMPGKTLLSNAAETGPGEHVQILLAKGELACLVERVIPERDAQVRDMGDPVP